MSSAHSILLRLAISVPAILVLASIWLLSASWRRTDQVAEWVTHSYQVQRELDQLLSSLREVQSSHRGFVLTGDESFLNTYPIASETAQLRLRRVEHLVAGQGRQREQAAEVRNLGTLLLLRTSETVALERGGQHAAATARIAAGDGMRLMDRIRRVVDEIRTEEERLLATHLEELAAQTTHQRRVAAGIIASQILLGVGLSVLAQKFANLRELVTMCAWSKKIKHRGEWVRVEDYLAEEHGVDITHGISPEEAAKHLAHARSRTGQA